MKRPRAPLEPVAWVVRAKVSGSIRQISRRFQLKEAAEQYRELALSQYPDAYVAGIEKRERLEILADRIYAP